MTAYLLETSPWNPATQSVENFNFASGIADDAALGTALPYSLRLRDSFTHEISVFPDNQPGGSQASVGSVILNNVDGALDFLLDYSWGGRSVVVKTGPEDGLYSDFTVAFTGSALDISADQTDLAITIRDNSWKLVSPLQKNKFLGNGGSEGGRDLQNKPKPLSFGLCKNATPVLVNAALLVHQVHDGAIEGIAAVYDDAVTLNFFADYANYAALAAAVIPRGAYATCLAQGYLRLGAPAAGALTADVKGQYYSSVNLSETVRQIILSRSSLIATDLKTSDFTELASDLPGRISGLYYQEPTDDLDSFLETILGTGNVFWFFSSTGLLRVRQFKFRSAVASVSGYQIKSLQRALSAKPVYSILVNYDRNLTVVDASSFSISANTLNSYLEDEIINVQTDSAGGGGDWSNVKTKMVTILGDSEANPLRLADFQEVTPKPWITVDPDGVVAVINPGATTDTATLRASLNDYYTTDDIVVRKILGPQGQWMRLTATSRVLHLTPSGTPITPSESTMISLQGNYVGPVTWFAVDNLGRSVSLTGSGTTRTLSVSAPQASPLLSNVRVTVIDANGLFAKVKIVFGRREATLVDLAMPWDNLSDPNNTKPDDNATNSKDPLSPFGNSTVGSFISRTVTLESLLAPTGTIRSEIDDIKKQLDEGTDTIGASRLTALEVSLRSGAPQLLINGDFGDGFTAWNPSGGGWLVVKGYSIGPFAQNNGFNGAQLYQDVPVSPGVSYSLSVEMDPDVVNGSQAYVQWLTSGQSPLGDSASVYTDSWVRANSAEMVAPSNAMIARVRLRQNSNSPGRWTRVQFQQGAATVWRNDASVQSALARITTEETVRLNAVAAVAERVRVTETQMNGSADSFLKSRITDVETSATNQFKTVNLSIQTLTSSITALGAPNLLGNGAYHNGFSGWALSGGSGTWSIYQPSVGEPDTFAAIYGGNASTFMFTDTQVQGGLPYCIGFESACDDWADGGRMYLEYWTPGYGQLLQVIDGPQARGDWGRTSGGPYYAPSNATIARLGFKATNNSGNWRRISRMQIQQSTTPTAYSDAQSLGALSASVTTQAGTLASLGNTVAGLAPRLEAFWQTEANAAGTTAFMAAKVQLSNGTITSDVSLGAKKIGLYSDVNGTWLKTFDVVGGNVWIYGNLAVAGSVSVGNMKFGTTGEVSLYSRDDMNYNNQNYWVSFMGINVSVNEGAPIRGSWSCFVRRAGGTGECWIRVVRLVDGTAIKYGSGGMRIVVPAEGMFWAGHFVDSVDAGVTSQYELQIMCGGGTTISEEGRFLDVRELIRDHFDEIYIAARSGEGPGAGNAGGGNINGDYSGSGGTGGTNPTGGNIGYSGGGLRAKSIDLQ
jgi:hypothetical protein